MSSLKLTSSVLLILMANCFASGQANVINDLDLRPILNKFKLEHPELFPLVDPDNLKVDWKDGHHDDVVMKLIL